MTSLGSFVDLYFAFLLSGNAKDFTEAHGAMSLAMQEGATLEDVQLCMDSSHASADMLVVLTDTIRDMENG